VCAEFRGQTSINFCPDEHEILLYEDGSFEVVEDEELDEEDEEASASYRIRSRESDGSYPTPVPASEAYKI
jgi:hypothetical protein